METRQRDHWSNWSRPIRTQAEVAAIMTARGHPMTRADLWHIEQGALRKLKELLADLDPGKDT